MTGYERGILERIRLFELYDCTKNITARPWKYFVNPLLVNTVRLNDCIMFLFTNVPTFQIGILRDELDSDNRTMSHHLTNTLQAKLKQSGFPCITNEDAIQESAVTLKLNNDRLTMSN